jgi:hypothetical protein
VVSTAPVKLPTGSHFIILYNLGKINSGPGLQAPILGIYLEQVKIQQALNPFPSGFSIEAHQIPSPNMSREDKRYMILLVLGSMTNSASQTVGISKSDISTLENSDSEVSNRHGYANSIPLTLNAHPRNYALGGDLQIFGTIETMTFAG